MKTKKCEARILAVGCAVVLASMSGWAAAQSKSESRGQENQAAERTSTAKDKHEKTAARHVNDAVKVVRQMEKEPRMKERLQQAKGVFIVPTYGRAALGVGVQGGSGVLLVKHDNGTWSDPSFYNIGGISAGAQIGAERGPIAMVLNNEKAVNRFMQKNDFSLTADAGLTVVNWEKHVEGAAGAGDVIVWSENKGLFGNVVAVGVNDVRFNQSLTNAYYGETVAIKDITSGKLKNARSEPLKQALAATSTGTATGSSGSTSGTKASGDNKQ